MKTNKLVMALQAFTFSCLLTGFQNASSADEGMWLFNDPPRKLLQDKYGFDATNEWLEHVQKSSVRFNSGGSGSFVSEDGLVMSNHHVGADALQKLSTPEKNYYRDGFFARTRDEEVPCHDLELNVLMSIEDVTERVNAAVKAGSSPEAAFLARRAIMAEIEKDSLEKTGLRSDVVTLYQGGKYQLYRYKKYTDVRLVFAPEMQIAFFGGDPDNFEFPRYCLDICFFRVYEDGKPVKLQHFLKWSKSGAKENELVFVSGHPGRTSRSLTMTELEYARDRQFPYTLDFLHRLEVLLSVYSSESAENARKAKEDLFGVQNSRKAREGGLAGLLDPAIMAKKQSDEQKLKSSVAKMENGQEILAAWDKIASAQRTIADNALRYNLLERGQAFNSKQFAIARTLLRAAAERPKPNAERLREFRDSARESLELDLFSDEPIYDDYEQIKLADSLTWLVAKIGYDNKLVQSILAGKSPRERAAELIQGTKVDSVEFRKKLYEGGAAAVDSTDDAMIALAKLVDPEARAVRKTIESLDETKQQAHAQIAKARFALYGTSVYPDATFTLRLAFGEVKGYLENGKEIAPITVYSGLYERSAEHENKPPFDLPPRWVERKPELNLQTPFNFVSTADIIGGNSGSPVINRNAELVGIIFDGNIYSLVLDFIYTDEKARAVSVHSAGIIEALRNVYKADSLLKELSGGK